MQNYEPGRGLSFASGVQQGGMNPPGQVQEKIPGNENSTKFFKFN